LWWRALSSAIVHAGLLSNLDSCCLPTAPGSVGVFSLEAPRALPALLAAALCGRDGIGRSMPRSCAHIVQRGCVGAVDRLRTIRSLDAS